MDLALRHPALAQRIGAITLVVLGLLIALLIAFDGCTARPGFRATVYFEHSGGLREGAEVHVASSVVGKVTAITLVSARLSPPGHLLHPTGGVAVTIRIDNRYRHMAPLEGEFFLAAKGFFGERYLAIGAPPEGEERGRDLREGDEVRGIDPPRLDRMLIRAHGNLQVSRAFARAVKPEADALMDALRTLSATLAELEHVPGGVSDARASMNELVREARALATTWAAGRVSWADITSLAERAETTATRMGAEIADVRARMKMLAAAVGRLGERIPDDLRERFARALEAAEGSLARAERALATARELAAMVARGEGTIGALLHDPEFPEDAKELGRTIKRQPWKLIGRHKTSDQP
jgi:phospholipid/cholesterol/gamma-HCH transport system substrate-binding protein